MLFRSFLSMLVAGPAFAGSETQVEGPDGLEWDVSSGVFDDATFFIDPPRVETSTYTTTTTTTEGAVSTYTTTTTTTVSTERSDAFDGYLYVFSVAAAPDAVAGTVSDYEGLASDTVRSASFEYEPSTTECEGQQLRFSQAPILVEEETPRRGGPQPTEATVLSFERVVYVSPTQTFGRLLTLATNETDTAVTAWIAHDGNLGSDSDTITVATSSGDTTIGVDDNWVVTGGDPDDPEVGHLIQDDSGSSRAVVAVRYDDDSLAWIYPVTVAPGETVAIASFAMLTADDTSTALVSGAVDSVGADLLACMTDDEKAAVRNFDFSDTDEDGVEAIFDNCPDDANADQADADDNGVGTVCDSDEEADSEVDTDTDTDADTDADSSDPVDEPSGCGCTSAPVPMSAMWLVGALALVGLRRRR